ncbi:MAG: hypothetical protein F4X65_05005 [Chloroflexi bacterium]|nr:hypothetical protein [Chloroflexota bacterium]
MARLWARTTTFESVSEGDQLPILVKWETRETIGRMVGLVETGDGARTAVERAGCDEDAENEGSGQPGADDAPIQGLLSYVTELLEKGFPLPRIMGAGSAVSIRSLLPVKAEDTVSLTGQVVGKNSSGALGLVECLISLENQDQELVAEAKAVIAFPL